MNSTLPFLSLLYGFRKEADKRYVSPGMQDREVDHLRVALSSSSRSAGRRLPDACLTERGRHPPPIRFHVRLARDYRVRAVVPRVPQAGGKMHGCLRGLFGEVVWLSG